MGFIDKVFDRLAVISRANQIPIVTKAKTDGVLTAKEFASLVSNFVAGTSSISEISAIENLETIYRCITVIIEQVGMLPYEVYKLVDNKPEPYRDGEYIDLLFNPNPAMTGNMLMCGTIGWLKIKGYSYWWIRPEANKKPTLWLLPSSQVQPVNPTEYPPSAYRYNSETSLITIPASEIIRFKYWSPLGLNYATSPMKSARHTANLDYQASVLNRTLFENSGLMSALMATDKDLEQSEVDKFAESFRKQYAGINNAGKLAFLSGGWQAQKFGFTPVEMQYILGRKLNRENICSAFGVPPSMAGVMEFANYSNMDAQERGFWEKTCQPLINFLEDIINSFFLSHIRKDIYFAFDTENIPTLQKMKQEAWATEYQKIQCGASTPNRYIVKFTNEKPVPWGDTFWGQLGLTPIGSLDGTDDALYGKMTKTEQRIKSLNIGTLFPTFKSPELITTQKQLTNKRRAYNSRLQLTPEMREILWNKFAVITERQESKFAKDIRKLLQDQSKKFWDDIKNEVLDFNTNDRSRFDVLFDVETWVNYFHRGLRTLYFTFLRQAGMDALGELRLQIPFQMNSPSVLLFLGEKPKDVSGHGTWFEGMVDYINSTLRNIHLTTRDDVWTAIQQGLINGESITEIEQRFTNGFGIDYRSERIARTEINTTNNFGHYEAYYQSKVVEGVEWLATKDDRSRDWHAGAFESGQGCDGEVVTLGSAFTIPPHDKYPQEQCRFPGDPNLSGGNRINCRCRTLPILKE
jgi:HK97 family phage portal protein